MDRSNKEKQGSRDVPDKNQKPGSSDNKQQKDKIEKPLKQKTVKGKSTFLCAGKL